MRATDGHTIPVQMSRSILISDHRPSAEQMNSSDGIRPSFSWKASSSRWVFATYVWNDQETDAVIAPAEGVPVAIDIAGGKRHDASAPSGFQRAAAVG